MAGIYIHIPYCQTRCNYCDFYKTTNLASKTDFINALKSEIVQRSDFFVTNDVETIYFGGGTPSVLNVQEINSIFNQLNDFINVSNVSEITLEVNPDDFTSEWGSVLKNESPVNRLSFGLQSVFDKQLRTMGRRHNSIEGIRAIERANKLGFGNITVDLIYGLPGLDLKMWSDTLNEVLNLPVKHLSAYHLTFEEGTPFFTNRQKGLMTEIDDELSLEQFELLLSKTNEKGILQYEISNFAVPGFESMHNSNYWYGKPYLGLGPSAHSFQNNERRWNTANVSKYIGSVASNNAYFEKEYLSETDKYNELIMLGLRTTKGIDISSIEKLDGSMVESFLNDIRPLIEKGDLVQQNNFVYVSPSSKFLTDGIIQSLFQV